jgi:putative Mg2+ transporter-C (MgtC) family protein
MLLPHPTHLEISLRLGAAILAGALIGLERQWSKHTAGVRTHSLVALGAALFVLLAPLVGTPQETARMAAQVVTGIGFLGAGVLMRTGLTVHGLNTAATVWCTAAVGVLCAAADYWSALLGTLAVLLVNLAFRPVSRMLTKFSTRQAPQGFHYSIRLSCDPARETAICSLLTQLVNAGPFVMLGLEQEPGTEISSISATLSASDYQSVQLEQITTRLNLEPGVKSISWKLDPASLGD